MTYRYASLRCPTFEYRHLAATVVDERGEPGARCVAGGESPRCVV